MTKQFIQNRKGEKIAVVVDEAKPRKSLAFVMHGLGGFKEQPYIEAWADVLRQHAFTAVRFDTTNTFGESEGRYEDATVSNYYEDLEDVIKWASQQVWYQAPFLLVGHSLGGICTALYAQQHLNQVKALAPISTVVSGRLSMEARDATEVAKWQRTGWLVRESQSKPGVIKRLPWSHMEDRLKYNLLLNVQKLTMPVLLMVGENDDTTPPAHQQILYDALPGPKELHIVKGAPHSFYEKGHLEETKQIFDRWLKKIDN